ncbi:MAG: hypothetical protein K2L12_06745 [Clostridia bacterium]|nr:hypothetical protein [Clostridia bacterium]
MGNCKCYRCKYFDRYYTKGTKHFNLTEIGLCSKKRNIVQKNEGCDGFVVKQHGYRAKIVATRCLNDLLTELSELRKFIEAEKAESEEL